MDDHPSGINASRPGTERRDDAGAPALRDSTLKTSHLEAKLKESEACREIEAAEFRRLALKAAELEARLREGGGGTAERAAEPVLTAKVAELEVKLKESEACRETEAAEFQRLALKASELDAHLRQAEQRAQAARTQQLAAQAESQTTATPIPALEPALEPGWSKALAYLRQSQSAAYAHLRRLAATPLEDGQRAQLKAAAAALAQGTDALTTLGELWDEVGPPPMLGRLEPAVAAAVAVWEPALRRRGISLVRRQDAPLPPALFHPEGLRLALYQVLRNAYESMPRGGALTVRLFKDDAFGWACVSISDTGTGFSREALARLPVPFASTKPGHLGIGLPLTRRILDRWGADLEAVNDEKIGAAVTLRFALSQDAPPPMQGEAIS